MQIREFRLSDWDALIALWLACGLHPNQSDRRAALAHKLERDPDLFLVIEEQGRLIASVLGTYDGRRGWINRLAVSPEAQRRAIGSALMREIERRLRAKGCEKINLLVDPANRAVETFYQHLGYRSDELIFMGKWLHEAEAPGIPPDPDR